MITSGMLLLIFAAVAAPHPTENIPNILRKAKIPVFRANGFLCVFTSEQDLKCYRGQTTKPGLETIEQTNLESSVTRSTSAMRCRGIICTIVFLILVLAAILANFVSLPEKDGVVFILNKATYVADYSKEKRSEGKRPNPTHEANFYSGW